LLATVHTVDGSVRQSVINFGGGVYNHELFWEILGPSHDQAPTREFAQALVRDFGSFEKFKEQLSAAALGWFGSGWAWLCADNKTKKLVISGMGNQECPLSVGLYPLMNIDVWEHAYYLQYQNRRAEFVAAFWHVINWQVVEKRYESFLRR
jgi:Fe-Mn family superoxide dismutase